MATHFDDKNFEEMVIKSKIPVVVDFYADWCGPCKMMSPVIEKMAKEFEGKILVGKLDVDNNQETSSKFGIQSIPTVLYFKDGKIANMSVGFKSEEDLKRQISELLK